MNQNNFYELTRPQKNIWNMEQFFEGTTISNIGASIIFNEPVDAKMLEQAINNIVKKNDSFRIKIHLENGKPVQEFSDFQYFSIDVEKIKDESELEKINQEIINYQFTMLDSCLFYFKIATFENGYGALVFTVHHMIADSWSLGIFAKTVLQEYHAIQNNENLPDSDTSYAKYIQTEQEYQESKKYETDKKYWNEIFQTIPEQVSFPSNEKMSSTMFCKAQRESFLLNSDLVKNINSFCSNNKISVFNFLMAIYSIYLSRVSHIDDFVIGTPILNRANFKEKQTMGMFINTVPVRVHVPQNKNFMEFTHNLSSNIMSVLKHQRYSYTRNFRRFKE